MAIYPWARREAQLSRKKSRVMPRLPFEGLDPDAKGSRFTWRPGFVVLTGEASEEARAAGRTAETSVRDVIGEWILEPDAHLGEPKILDGAIGRGAEGWAPVLEWAGAAAGAGVIGALSWEATKAMARSAAKIIRRIRDGSGAPTYISRGFAVLIAMDEVLQRDKEAVLAVEAADEPSAFGELQTPELNYVGIEPWIVLLVDFEAKRRWVVVVRPTGGVHGVLEVALEAYEEDYSRVGRPRRESRDEPEG